MNVKRNSDTSENSLYPKKGRLLYRCLRRLPKRTDPQDYSDRLLHSNANAASIIEPAASTGKMAAHVSHRGHDMSYSVTPIGIVRSCFKEKFASRSWRRQHGAFWSCILLSIRRTRWRGSSR